MEINELMIKEENELTENQAKFVLIHNNILNAGAMITNSVISLSKNLKVMRDEKLYLEANCESFEDYAEKICGLKRSQAYKYIQVLEKLGEDFVHSSGQIGITKLTMISSLTNEKKEELINTTDVENITVKELKEKIELLEQDIETKNDELQSEKTKVESLNKQIIKFEKEKNEIVHSNGQSDNSELENKIKKLKEELKTNKERLEASKTQLKINSETIGKLKKEKELASNFQLVEFKLVFNEIQSNISKLKELFSNLPEDKKEGCKQALKKVGELCSNMNF